MHVICRLQERACGTFSGPRVGRTTALCTPFSNCTPHWCSSARTNMCCESLKSPSCTTATDCCHAARENKQQGIKFVCSVFCRNNARLRSNVGRSLCAALLLLHNAVSRNTRKTGARCISWLLYELLVSHAQYNYKKVQRMTPSAHRSVCSGVRVTTSHPKVSAWR